MTTWPIFPLIFHNDFQTSISNMASSNDDTSYYFARVAPSLLKNTANRADRVSISSIFVHSPFPSLSSPDFLFHLPSSTLIFFKYLYLFAFINLHSPSFIFIHLHSHSFYVINFQLISLYRPSGFSFIQPH